jgi:hypothetical protein
MRTCFRRLEVAVNRRLFLIAILGALAGCGDSTPPTALAALAAPETTESLPLTLSVRAPVLRERLPSLTVTGLEGSVRVKVARPDIACTLASAGVARSPGVLTVVARVSGNPLALCASGFVVEYSGAIGNVAPGRYQVLIYEALGDGQPRLLGMRTVIVVASND